MWTEFGDTTVSVKILSMLLVTFFAFGSQQMVPLDLSRSEITVFYTERRKACFEETLLVARFLHH